MNLGAIAMFIFGAAILWGDNSKAETATKALKISAQELKELDLIDDIIDEPLEGAHRDYETTAKNIKDYFLEKVKELKSKKMVVNPAYIQKIKKIEEIINEKIRPALAMDGGSLELIDVRVDEDGLKLMIKYLGACSGCASSSSTLWAIEQELINHTGYDKIKVIEVH